MSHFTVIVFGENVDEQLAPYEEELGECPKWDWYVIGGRWRGYFKLKPGAEGEVGEPGAFGNEPDLDADVARKGDIDVEGMQQHDLGLQLPRYKAFQEIIAEHGVPPRWEEVRVKHCGEGDPDWANEDWAAKMAAARDEYHALPVIKALQQAGLMPFGGEVRDLYDMTEEEFITKVKRESLLPYAFVKDGQWFEKAEMGWWGLHGPEAEEYQKQFQEAFDAAPDDEILTLVDCHI